MRVVKSGDGARIRLNLAEAHVLEQLFGELDAILDADPSDPVQRRLYPDAYFDPEQALAFRDLTESALRRDRSERVADCVRELRAGRSLVRTEVNLDADGAERWLRVVNDLRLSFGTRLGITEDDDIGLDERDPQAGVRVRYLWLTALQDAIVNTLMR